jgi:hypothetical protein
MYVGHLHAYHAHANLARWGTFARPVGRPLVGQSYHGPPPANQGLCDPTSLSTGGVFSPLHKGTGLRRFVLIFSVFCNKPSFFSPITVTPVMRFLAGRCAAAHGLRATCIWRAESSGGLPATSFGGLQHFHGPPLLSGRLSSQFCVHFLSVFVFFMFDVLAHILTFGSVQHLYASYIYVLCVPAPPTLFFMRFSCVFLFAPFMCTPNYLFGGLLVVATSFHPPGPSVSH